MDFGDLEDDKEIKEKLDKFHNSVEKITKIVNTSLNSSIYEKLTVKEKADYDLFTAFTLNTLYWLYLRSKGEDPNENEVKDQLNRVKEYMMKAKQAHERNTIRPKIDQAAAGRFIKHGVQYKKSKNDNTPNKKTKFSP